MEYHLTTYTFSVPSIAIFLLTQSKISSQRFLMCFRLKHHRLLLQYSCTTQFFHIFRHNIFPLIITVITKPPFSIRFLFCSCRNFCPQASRFLVSINNTPFCLMDLLLVLIFLPQEFLLILSNFLSTLLGVGKKDIICVGIPSNTLLISFNLPLNEMNCFF